MKVLAPVIAFDKGTIQIPRVVVVLRECRELTEHVGQVGEARLMVMAALMIADDLAAIQDENDALKAANTPSQGATGTVNGDGRLLERLARRIEDIAARLESA